MSFFVSPGQENQQHFEDQGHTRQRIERLSQTETQQYTSTQGNPTKKVLAIKKGNRKIRIQRRNDGKGNLRDEEEKMKWKKECFGKRSEGQESE